MKVGFIPQYIGPLGGNELFEFRRYDPTDAYGADRIGFAATARRLRDAGHEVTTIDRCDPSDIDVCVFIDMNFDYLDTFLSMDERPRLVYIHREPPSVRPYNAASRLPRYAAVFDAVLTWNPDIADGLTHASEYNIPQYLEPERSSQAFEDRRLLVNVSSRKYSKHPEELYSARERVISYFDENHHDEFTLYGLYWNQRPRPEDVYHHRVVNPPIYRCYRGLVDDKVEVYRSHRFALCFENMTGISGYVTEKLFDCLRTGIVPIYWGATDIDDYVPDDVYVDYREFSTPQSLYEYLSNVNEDEYEAYIERAQEFIHNDASHVEPSQYADAVYDAAVSGESGYRSALDLRKEVDIRGMTERLEDRPNDISPRNRIHGIVRLCAQYPDLVVSNPSAILNGIRSLL